MLNVKIGRLFYENVYSEKNAVRLSTSLYSMGFMEFLIAMTSASPR
jgi:hypothetical protein